MEHAKKLMLVDPSVYERQQLLQQQQTMPQKTLSYMDKEISETLNGDASDDVKAKLYIAVLKKYKAFDDNFRSELAAATNTPSTLQQDLETQLVQTLPVQDQHKARRLMRYLKDDPDVRWSDKGELIYRKSLVPNSHMIDLVTDIFKRSSTSNVEPEGWQDFVRGLVEANVPTSLITNKARLKPQQQQQLIETPRNIKTQQATAAASSSSTYASNQRKKVATERRRTAKKTWLNF